MFRLLRLGLTARNRTRRLRHTAEGLDLSLRHRSAQGRYMVQMEPPAAAPAINQMHSWQIR